MRSVYIVMLPFLHQMHRQDDWTKIVVTYSPCRLLLLYPWSVVRYDCACSVLAGNEVLSYKITQIGVVI